MPLFSNLTTKNPKVEVITVTLMTAQKETILVTGGAGFIGSTMVRQLLRVGYNVRVLDNLTYASGYSWENLEGLDIEKIKGDICDFQDCHEAVIGVEAVLHFAAESHVTRSEEACDLFFRVNVSGTKNLIEAAHRFGIKRFIHISTDEVYGSIGQGFFREEDKLPGDRQASSPYAKSKALADDLVQAWLNRIPYLCIVRPTNNFGPRQHPEKALPRWITRLMQGKKIPIWGRGNQVRDWLYVEDCCQAILMLLERRAKGVYNIAANNEPEITNLEMAKMVIDILHNGQDPKKYLEFIEDPRPGHDFRYGISTQKILQDYAWRPLTPIKEALRQTVEWYFDNVKWWQERIPEAESIYEGKEKPLKFEGKEEEGGG